MNVTHLVVNHDDCIALIYQSDKFGKVVVFRTNQIDLEYPIEIYNPDTGEKDEKNIMELIMEVLPV